MEFIGKLVNQSPLREVNWTNPQTGENRLITSVDLRVSNGVDEFVAEVTNDDARALAVAPIPLGTWLTLHCKLSVNTKEDRSFNRIRVVNYGKL